MSGDGAMIGSIAAAGAAGYSAFLTYRNSKKANDLTARKVSLDEFDAQQERYRKLIDEMQDQLDRLSRLLKEEQSESDVLRQQVRVLHDTVAKLQRAVTQARARGGSIEPGGDIEEL